MTQADFDRGTPTGDVFPRPDPTVLTTQALAREIAALKELFGTKFSEMEKAVALLHEDQTRTPTQIDRQVGNLQALIQEKIDALDDRINRGRKDLEAMITTNREIDTMKIQAVQLQFTERDIRANQIMEQARTAVESALQAVEKQIAPFRELNEERFAGIQTQFRERDTRSERESRDNKVAVDAAFAAQAAAAAKQDESNQKAIDKSERATAETLNKQSDLFNSTTDALAAQLSDVKERLTRMEGASRSDGERIQALSGQVATALTATNEGEGRRGAVANIWGYVAVLSTLILAIAGVVVAVVVR